jgi:hypothetical protein
MTFLTKNQRNNSSFSQKRVRRIESLERRDLMAGDTVEMVSPHEMLDTASTAAQVSTQYFGGEFNDKLAGKDDSSNSAAESLSPSKVENIADPLFEGNQKDEHDKLNIDRNAVQIEGNQKDEHNKLDIDSTVAQVSKQYFGGEFNDKLEGKDGFNDSAIESLSHSKSENIANHLFDGNQKDEHNKFEVSSSTVQISQQYFGGEFNDKLEGKE